MYLHDTEQTIEDFYKMTEVVSPECSEAGDMIALMGRDRPLVTVGPFTIFVNNDTGVFSVHDAQTLMYLVRLKSNEQSKYLRLASLLEKGWRVPRFSASLIYSEDGVYKEGIFSVVREDETHDRLYFDSKGSGVFDIMHVYENGVPVKYHLNNLTWERAMPIDESPQEE